ncbi:MAG TPA: excinuclease ABC subunit UvrC [Candidatus Sulfotelmatobacter sp.]|nr:excinuclease ABC subunit UvrC [Candidatus Sulfotelmatobacter sp.]
MLTKKLEKKLSQLPKTPGVYFHKNSSGEIIYVGKAAVLRNRVRQYFQKSRNRDPKTVTLVSEIADVDWMSVDSEMEALFLEAEMIRRYMPKYNILLRDDKAPSYVRIDYASDHPTVTLTRRPLDDKARYFGPYYSSSALKQALKILRKIFPYSTSANKSNKRATLYYHIGLDPGLEEGRTSLSEYRANLRKLIAVIEGKKDKIIKQYQKEMKVAAKAQDFEKAAMLRNKVSALQGLSKQVIFSDREFQDISKDHALSELVNLLSLSKYPKRIEGYDISHMQGTDVVASMVVFANGASDKASYRKFKTSVNRNDDFANMHEIILRRFSEKNVKAWTLPDLVLIDGGKGQLDSAIKARDIAGYNKVPFIGLAKRYEQIVLSRKDDQIKLNEQYLKKLSGYKQESKDFIVLNLPPTTNLIKLLQRIRDESHRFAVSYHSTLKTKRVRSSELDAIPGIGPKTKKKLLKQFGSVSGVSKASQKEVANAVGQKIALTISAHLTPSP